MKSLLILSSVLSMTFALGLAPASGGPDRTAGLVAQPLQGLQGEASTALVLASLGGSAPSLPPAFTPVAAGGTARPIAGWVKFCRLYADECRFDPTERDVVRLTPELWRTVNEVNTSVNAAIRPITDAEHWNELDRWDLAEDGSGDCEDYQLLKRRKLAMLGVPRRAMVMTVVLDERNEGHAVLMLRTDRGDFILDNKRDEILSWHRTGYVYVKRESQNDVSWVSLNHVTGVGATAAR